MTIELTKAQLRTNKTLFDWCLRKGMRAIERRHYIQATRWCQLAAETAGFGCGLLASKELESLLHLVAKKIPPPETPKNPNEEKRHWLHVLTDTSVIGGHTILVKRWIEADQGRNQHSVIILRHQDPDDGLRDAAEATGGKINSLGDLYQRPLDCAQKLRELAWAHADYVVLHTHMWDVVPSLAFGIQGGPPVFLLNHADHLFWVGGPIADLILQLRPEGTLLAEKYRGIDRNYQLNIPLSEKHSGFDEDGSVNPRERHGIPSAARVFLTIGRAEKYEPREGIDFIACAKDLLQQVPGSYLIAVGPTIDNPAWRSAFEDTQHRLIPVGSQRNLAPYHMSSDIYLEGFPFGSLTALLEAGLAGLPCVRAPAVVPPIFRATGPAIEEIPVPSDPAEYVRYAVELAKLTSDDLRRMGAQLSARVDKFHRKGWVNQLAGIPIPNQHQIYQLGCKPASLTLADSKILRWLDGDALHVIRWNADRMGLDTSLDLELIAKALRQLPDMAFIKNIFKTFINRPTHRPHVKNIS